MPKMLSREDIQKIVAEIIEQMHATQKDFGKVMKETMARVKVRQMGSW